MFGAFFLFLAMQINSPLPPSSVPSPRCARTRHISFFSLAHTFFPRRRSKSFFSSSPYLYFLSPRLFFFATDPTQKFPSRTARGSPYRHIYALFFVAQRLFFHILDNMYHTLQLYLFSQNPIIYCVVYTIAMLISTLLVASLTSIKKCIKICTRLCV